MWWVKQGWKSWSQRKIAFLEEKSHWYKLAVIKQLLLWKLLHLNILGDIHGRDEEVVYTCMPYVEPVMTFNSLDEVYPAHSVSPKKSNWNDCHAPISDTLECIIKEAKEFFSLLHCCFYPTCSSQFHSYCSDVCIEFQRERKLVYKNF